MPLFKRVLDVPSAVTVQIGISMEQEIFEQLVLRYLIKKLPQVLREVMPGEIGSAAERLKGWPSSSQSVKQEMKSGQ
jgi:hypothetical protein